MSHLVDILIFNHVFDLITTSAITFHDLISGLSPRPKLSYDSASNPQPLALATPGVLEHADHDGMVSSAQRRSWGSPIFGCISRFSFWRGSARFQLKLSQIQINQFKLKDAIEEVRHVEELCLLHPSTHTSKRVACQAGSD